MSLSLDLGRVARVVVGNPGTTDSKKSEEEANSKAASANSTAESSADSTAADEAGKAATLSGKTSDKKYNVTVQYGSDAAIPADASLKITELKEESKAFKNARDAVVEEKKKADKDFDEKTMGMAALDISILDQDGNAVEPAKGAKVDVQIELTKLPETTDSKSLKDSLEVQHIKGDVATTVADTAAKADGEITVDDGTATADFSVDHFSTFAVTWDQQLETNVLTADGKTYKITAEYNDDAGIPKGSKLEAKEVTGSDKEEYVSKTNDLVYGKDSGGSVSFSRFFDIGIVGKSGKEIEPKSAVKITITAQGTDEISGDVNVIHFPKDDDIEMIPAERNAEGGIEYSQDSFSVIGLFEAKPMKIGETLLADTSTNDTDSPAYSKTLKDNGNGTYDITLSVTGKSNSSTIKGKADVVVVFDTSSSMYYPTDVSETGAFGYLLNPKWSYYTLYYRTSSYGGYQYFPIDNESTNNRTLYYYDDDTKTYKEYSGLRYNGQRGAAKRFDVAKNAIAGADNQNSLAASLLSQNSGNEDIATANVTLSLITFSSKASTYEFGNNERTASLAEFQSAINSAQMSGATNWEDALNKAQAIPAREGSTKYVIFVSDGDPSVYMTRQGNDNTAYLKNGYYGNGTESGANSDRAYNAAKNRLNKDDPNFFGVGVFGNVTRMKNLVEAAGSSADSHYQAATDQEALNAAFANIVKSITNSATFRNVTMTDNITNLTATNLVNGNADNFRYQKGGKDWTDAPAATFTSDANGTGKKVSWDLGNRSLENNVTYSVTFTVWPSQETYDLVADLNNGTKSYSTLTDDEKAQITDKGTDGKYGLRTNTSSGNTITYTAVNTVTEDGQTSETTRDGEGTFINPDPIPLTNAEVTVKKIWDDDLDENVERPNVNFLVGYAEDGDGQVTSTDSNAVNVTLGNDEGTTKRSEYGKTVWFKSIAVAPGLIVDGKTLEPGHDYQILETTDLPDYDGSSSRTHPMLYNSATEIKDQDGSGEAVLSVTNTLIKKDIVIKKTSADGKTLLSGAEFTLTKGETTEAATAADGIGDDGKITIPKSGEITIKGLPVGDYTLTETKAPDGYIIQSGGIKFTVSKDCITLKDTEDSAATADGLTLTVKNNAGTALPNTGSTGTLPYTLGGLAIIAMAALMYGFVLRRNNRERRFK